LKIIYAGADEGRRSRVCTRWTHHSAHIYTSQNWQNIA
jgi:hypothetical protein